MAPAGKVNPCQRSAVESPVVTANELSAPRRHFQLRADMHGNLGGIVIDEMSDAVMRYAPELRPFPQRAHRGLFPCREDPAQAKAENIHELISNGGR